MLAWEGAGAYVDLWPNPVTITAWCQNLLVVPDDAPTFLQGLEDTSKDALNARLCCVVSIVLGRLGLLGSFPSSLPFPWVTCPLVGLTSPSSSSLLTGEKKKKKKKNIEPCLFHQDNNMYENYSSAANLSAGSTIILCLFEELNLLKFS